MSKVIENRSLWTIAFFKEDGKKYSPFESVNNTIKNKIYEDEAKKYYEENKEIFRIPTIKHGYAVNFFPNFKQYKVSNKESLDYYKKNEAQFKQKQAETLSIQLNYTTVNRDEVRAKIVKILQDIKAKKITFEKALDKYSDAKDTSTLNDKKSTKWITQNRHRASDIVFATKKGQISEVFEGRNNFQLFKIIDTSDEIPYPRAKDNIVSILQREKAFKDARAKRDEFYNRVEGIFSQAGGANLAKKFTEVARSYSYRPIPISTENNYSALRLLLQDLALRTDDNPLIINDQDLWVGCYEKTVDEHLPEFDELKTRRKAIEIVNRDEALEKLNQKFNSVFTSLNEIEDKKKLQEALEENSFEEGEAQAFKDISKEYKSFIDNNNKETFKIFNTKNEDYEQIIFVVSKVTPPTDKQFDDEKKSFIEDYSLTQKNIVVEKFYQNFLEKNKLSL